MRRPRRPLSSEERRLWAEVARSVRPLAGRLAEPEPAPVKTPATLAGVAATALHPAFRLAKEPPVAKPADKPALPPLAPLERRTARALARGRLKATGALDLHGLTQAEAHPRLIAFLRRAQVAGLPLVLVITGQGGSGAPGGERGVLRRVVPHWLGLPELRGIVLGFDEAGPRQGGAGALYVRLRRVRTV